MLDIPICQMLFRTLIPKNLLNPYVEVKTDKLVAKKNFVDFQATRVRTIRGHP